MAVLSVNLNKVALLRNSREGGVPSVCAAAEIAIAAGAHGITVHPRPDQRHIRPADVAELADVLQRHPQIEYNIEGNPFVGPTEHGYPGFDSLIESAHPHQATLVPDSGNQLTSDHGWDLAQRNRQLESAISRYQAAGARVCLFMDPDPEQIARVPDFGADRIELYTGPFADTVTRHGLDHTDSRTALATYRHAVEFAIDLGLGVNAGHDLDTNNLILFRQISGVLEVSIGHALIADALEVGLTQAVKNYLAALGH